MDGTVEPSAEDLLADLIARYEESLAEGAEPVGLDLSSVASDPALYERWQGVKSCLELVHRVQRAGAIDDPPPPEPGAGDLEASLLAGLALPKSLGRFMIQRRLGAGGVGLVYLAKDPRLGRLVALKVPRLETLANEDLRNRFLREAEAAARLSHPNVVPVLESGQDDLLCYIAAEYCEGPTLAEWLRSHEGPVPVRQAAAMVRQLSSAVQHAHSRGVLHRDIKPGNVLLVYEPSSSGQPDDPQSLVPKLTDFGMAKLQEHGDYDETHTGATIGTPAYMAPEQAAGRVRELDSRTDVYALGAVLYELLTAAPPFRGEAPVDVLRQVLDREPASIRRSRVDVPRDLEAICLKCLAKRPADRYQTAQQLADDLDRFLALEPILARPPGVIEGLGKWARRHPLAMGTAAVVACSLVALTIVTSIYNSRLSTAIVRADGEAETSRRLLYSANVQLAQQALLRDNVPQTLALLDACLPKSGQRDLREFSWRYLRAACNQQSMTLGGHQGEVFSVAYSPDGTALASAGKDRTVRVWDAATGSTRHVLHGHTSEVTCVAFSPTDDLLATGSEDHTIRLWNWRTGEKVRVIKALDYHVLAVAFSPDGRLLAGGGRQSCIRIWQTSDFKLLEELAISECIIRAIQFLPDGSRLVAADNESRLHHWKTSDWSCGVPVFRSAEVFFSLAVSKDQQIAAAGRRQIIDILTPDDQELRAVSTIGDAHLGWIQSLAYSPVDSLLASSGKDGAIRIWSTSDSRLQRTFKGHVGRVWSVAWSPSGRSLASAGEDAQIRVWNTRLSEQSQVAVAEHPFRAVAPVKNSDALISCDEAGHVTLWKGASRQPSPGGQLESSGVIEANLSPDGDSLAVATDQGQIEMWNLAGLTRRWAVGGLDTGASEPIAWSPDSSLLASHLKREVVSIFDPRTGHILKQLDLGERIWYLAFLPDNSLVITTGSAVRRWDHANSTILWTFPGAHHKIATSIDGGSIISDQDTRLSVIDAESGQLRAHLVAEGSVEAIAVSPDTRTLAIANSAPYQIELWDLATMRQLITIPLPNGLFAERISFTGDGKRLLTFGIHQSAHDARIFEWSAAD